MRHFVFAIMAFFMLTSCTQIQFMTADDVIDLGYEITEDAVYSNAEINGFPITAKLEPLHAIDTENISVLVSNFSSERKFTVKEIVEDGIANCKEDSRFKYETVRYKVILESNGLQLPSYYLQERAYYKVGSELHLMPLPEINAAINDAPDIEQLSDENITNVNYKVWAVRYNIQLTSGETEFVETSSTKVKYYENPNVNVGFGIIIEKWKDDNPDIEVEI